MNKKYLYILLVSCFLVACSSETPTVSPPQPEQENDENKDTDPNLDSDSACEFPKDFSDKLVGKKVKIKNELVVVRTYGDKLEGMITLAPSILRIPTELTLPGTDAYHALAIANRDSKLSIAAIGISLLDPAFQTLRVGTKLSALEGTVSKDKERFKLTLTAAPKIEHAKRPSYSAMEKADVSIVSMNLEYYMASPSMWEHSNGARDEESFNRQNTKILAAMKDMKADIYAICEIEEGNYSPAYLTKQLNQALGTTAYKFVDTGDAKVSSYTKNTFIYNSETLKLVRDCRTYDADYLQLRHIIQGFQKTGTGEKFILSLNHFKSKSGKASGSNIDKHDGQGAHNSRRVEEATNCLKSYAAMREYYGDNDVIVVGDLNSYSKEDPIRVFTDAGYVDELMKYSPDGWSYVYDGQVGYLDHILTSASMSPQVLHASVWDVNASEPSALGYQFVDNFKSDAYRYSDHNPVIVYLDLK